MFQFNDLVRGNSIVREVRDQYPETDPVFRKFNMRATCYDCPMKYAARRSGAHLDDLLVKVNEAIYKARGIPA
jgi:hypothetical protein